MHPDFLGCILLLQDIRMAVCIREEFKNVGVLLSIMLVHSDAVDKHLTLNRTVVGSIDSQSVEEIIF